MKRFLLAGLLTAILLQFSGTPATQINNSTTRKPAEKPAAVLTVQDKAEVANQAPVVETPKVVEPEPAKVETPAPNTDEVPTTVFCGSPAQRNTKHIVVSNALIGKQMASQYGWTGHEWNALLELWSCESSWTHTAINPDSGAGGIPQSWPASKMASAGDDWKTSPSTQIEWGLKYIASRYGTPSEALATHYAVNYY